MPLATSKCFIAFPISHSIPSHHINAYVNARTHARTTTHPHQATKAHAAYSTVRFVRSLFLSFSPPNRMLQVAAANDSVVSLNTVSDSDKRITNLLRIKTKTNRNFEAYQSKASNYFRGEIQSDQLLISFFCHRKKKHETI